MKEGPLKHVWADKVQYERIKIDLRTRKGSSGAMISCLGGDGVRTPPIPLQARRLNGLKNTFK